MAKALLEAVASSSAHGISRAAGTQAKPLKVMWILLFLIFLVLFFKGGINLVLKLKGNKLTKIYHMDDVPFVFPDLYFCPSNPYSGSYPFMLTSSEAELVNSEVSRILREFDELFDHQADVASMKAMYVQQSLPFNLTIRFLTVRKEQSILKAELTSNFIPHEVNMETFHHPENLICFKAVLTEDLKQKMMSVSSVFEIWLSTDPYFSDFNFNGHPILPIVDKSNESVPFLSWHPTHIVEKLKVSGYTMLIVPPGAYPSLKFENNFHLAPGNAYSVKLHMEENACSEELHRTHCINDHPLVEFTNPLTEQPEPFIYSSAVCYYMRKNSRLIDRIGCQMSMYPAPWVFRSWPRCLNASESTKAILENLGDYTVEDVVNAETDASEYCKTRIPCTYQQYGASYSFGKWPSIGSTTDQFFATSAQFSRSHVPALAKLVSIAREMQYKNHSAHQESLFRSYVSESMLSIRISAASVLSSQVVLTWSYSLTDFLADTGGLLGLYIGCSLLTLCELLELIYVLVEQAVKRRSQPKSPSDAAEASPEREAADEDDKNEVA